MSTTTRIYVVHSVAVGGPRLVWASHPAHALRHVADSLFTVKVATQEELVALIGKGVKVESVGPEQQELIP